MRCLTPARYNEDSHLIVPTCGSPGDRNGPVAQLVEHRTFNAVVAGSSPARLTILGPCLPSVGALPFFVSLWCRCHLLARRAGKGCVAAELLGLRDGVVPPGARQVRLELRLPAPAPRENSGAL